MSLGLDDDLLDVFCCASGATNSETDVGRREVLLCQIPSGLRERGGEKAELDVAFILFCQTVLVHGLQERV